MSDLDLQTDVIAPAIDVKAAVGAAHNYLKSIRELIGNSLEGLRLEEVELSDDKQTWFVTLGFDVPVKTGLFPNLLPSGERPYKREYKIFQIDSQTGHVKSMKIRNV